jgi:hypothetical protein
MKGLIGLAAASLLTIAAHAAPPSDESVDALFEAIDMQRGIDQTVTTLARIIAHSVDAQFQGMPLSEEQARTLAALPAKIEPTIREELNWKEVRPIYLQIYKDTLTQEEVDGLAAFLKSPAGKEAADKLLLHIDKEPFTKFEDDGATAFLKTPVGEALRDKQPVLRQKMSAALRPLTARIIAKMKAPMEDAIRKVEAGK